MVTVHGQGEVATQAAPSTETAPVAVHMSGTEWFSDVPGGLGRYFSDLFAALRTSDDVAVTASAFGTPDEGGASWGPIGGSTLSRVASSFAADLGLPADTVLDRHFSLFGRPALGPRGRNPLVVHFHGPWAAESAASGSSARAVRVKKMLERARYAGADRFIVLSRHSRNLLVEGYGVAEESIEIVPPGVDLSRFTVSPSHDGTGDGHRTVICVRRLESRMGIDVLIDAWSGVVAANPDARLVIVGEGSQEDALRAQVDVAGLGGSVRFEGRATDARLAELYAQASLSVIPSVALEGFGLIALESLASGTPPIVTDCGGLPDAVIGLDPTLIVPAKDASALTERLRSALDGEVPDSAACRSYAEQFTWQASAARHVDIYRAVTA